VQLIKEGSPRQIVAESVRYSRGPWEQLRGLIGRKLTATEALLLPHCPQIHTAFLAYPITVAFAKRESDAVWRILHRETLSPWRVSRWVSGAHLAIEMHADSPLLLLNPGDVIFTEGGLPG
jgi:hypothetical protein